MREELKKWPVQSWRPKIRKSKLTNACSQRREKASIFLSCFDLCVWCCLFLWLVVSFCIPGLEAETIPTAASPAIVLVSGLWRRKRARRVQPLFVEQSRKIISAFSSQLRQESQEFESNKRNHETVVYSLKLKVSLSTFELPDDLAGKPFVIAQAAGLSLSSKILITRWIEKLPNSNLS